MPTDAKVFCVIDATSGFHQVKVNEASSKLSTVVTNCGHFSFTVVPLEVCISTTLWKILTDGTVA